MVGQPANVEEALWKIDRKVFETALATMPQMQPLILPLLAKQDLVDLTQDITVYDLLKVCCVCIVLILFTLRFHFYF